MTKVVLILLVLGVSFSAGPMETAMPGDLQGDDHEHVGVTDAQTDAEGHRHGDSDDHHENEGDPCHHHVIHCCCSHAHVFQTNEIANLLGFGRTERLSVDLLQAENDPFARPPFHVPIA